MLSGCTIAPVTHEEDTMPRNPENPKSCFIVGPLETIVPLQSLLQKHLAVRVLSNSKEIPIDRLVGTCLSDTHLRMIVVVSRGFDDFGVAMCQRLHDALAQVGRQHVKILAIIEASEAKFVPVKELNGYATWNLRVFPLESEISGIAKVIKDKWGDTRSRHEGDLAPSAQPVGNGSPPESAPPITPQALESPPIPPPAAQPSAASWGNVFTDQGECEVVLAFPLGPGIDLFRDAFAVVDGSLALLKTEIKGSKPEHLAKKYHGHERVHAISRLTGIAEIIAGLAEQLRELREA